MDLQYPFSEKETLYAGLVPLVLTLIAGLAVPRLWSNSRWQQWGWNLGLAAAALIGARLTAIPAWKPASHWQWLPWCGVLCALASPVMVGLSRKWMVATTSCITVAAAWVLVPDRDNLPLPRGWMIVATAGFLTAVFFGIQRSFANTERRVFAVILAGAALSGCIVLMCAGSLRLALIGMSVAAAFTGSGTAQLLNSRSKPGPDAGLLFVILCAGILLARRLNSETSLPWLCFLLPPMAPLGCLSHFVPAISRARPSVRAAVQIAVSGLIALIAAGIAMAELLESVEG